MGSAKYFTAINLLSRYWQFQIADKYILTTALLMIHGIYKWVLMLMGLTNAPSISMCTMNNLFPNMLDSIMAVFLDDILIYSCMVKEHFMLLMKTLVHLSQYMLYCKLKKYSFLCNSTTFLGFDVIPRGMQISDSKVQSLN